MTGPAPMGRRCICDNAGMTKWWGEFELQPGETGRWRIGPMELYVRRDESDWVVAWTRVGGARDTAVEVDVPSKKPVPDGVSMDRYAMRETGEHLLLRPRLADRPVVVKPETPVTVPSGEAVTLYVGSPVWIEVAVGEGHGTTLVELPALQPSDTWAGPNTRAGMLCYGGRTLARRRFEDCTLHPHRAITRVDVENGGTDALTVEQLQLPAPMLALYAGADDVLLTESVSLTRKRSETEVELMIGSAAGPDGGELQRLSEPREVAEGNMVFQAFNRLFGRTG